MTESYALVHLLGSATNAPLFSVIILGILFYLFQWKLYDKKNTHTQLRRVEFLVFFSAHSVWKLALND